MGDISRVALTYFCAVTILASAEHMRKFLKWAYYKFNGPMIRQRQAMRASMPKDDLNDENIRNCRLLPNRKTLIELMPKSAIVAEVGVADGAFSKVIHEIAKPAELILVDAWHTDVYMPDEKRVRDHFETPEFASHVRVLKGFSTDVLGAFPDNYFDWIYIDTNHSYETTRDELLLSERLLKDGGRILGHDFCLGNITKPAVFGVIPAVNEFCVKRAWEFEYLTLETNGFHSFCLRKIAPSEDTA